MYRLSFFILLFIGLSTAITAQHHLSGQVLNQKEQPIEFATVAIFPISDSTDVQGVIVAADGFFKILDLKANQYKLVIQMLGYQDWEQAIILKADMNLGKIMLKEAATDLETVKIVAAQSTLESRLGKKVLKIGQDLANTGSTALEALEQIPSVTTTQRGGVQVRGSSDVLIYINGKPTRRDAQSLKYIAAENLEKIEVITNPSAEHDAEGVGGIINIVYRKDKTTKWKLESISDISLPISFSTGMNISVNQDKISFHSNFSIGYSLFKERFFSQRLNTMLPLERYENEINYNGTDLSGNLNMGIEYEVDSTLNMALEINYDRWDFNQTAIQSNLFQYRQQNAALQFEFDNQKGELENEIWLNYSLEKSFSKDQLLTLSLTAGGEDEVNTASSERLIDQNVPMEIQQFLKQSDETEGQRYYQGMLDYKIPFSKNGTLEMGVKADFIRYHILQRVELFNDTLIIPNNDFSMDMQKLGVYTLYKNKFKKLEYGIGLRMEQFSSTAIQRATQENFTQDYVRLFPSIQLLYELAGESHTIGFNFTKRIRRPGFFDVNPFISYEDPLNLKTGNPNLLPQIANLYEVSYHKGFNQFTTDLTLYRGTTTDVIQSLVTPLNDEQTLETKINFANRIGQGIEALLEWRPNKSLKTTATFTFGQVQFEDEAQAIRYNQMTNWSALLKQQIQLKNNWKIEVTGIYRTPSFEPQLETVENYYFNIFIRKKFKKGSLTFGVRDVFNTRIYAYTLTGADFQVERSYKWQTRSVSLGFRYILK